MEPGVVFDDTARLGGERAADDFENARSFARIVEAHAVDVAFKITLTEKFRERVLVEGRDGARVKAELFVEAIRERDGERHIADADRRGERFREGVHVDDLIGIEPEHGNDRATVESKLTVVIVFEDVSFVAFVRPCEEFVAAAEGRGDAGGEMMRRVDMRDVGANALELVDARPFVVDSRETTFHP